MRGLFFFKLIAIILTTGSLFAYRNDPTKSMSTNKKTDETSFQERSTSAGCLPPSNSAELNVNNVRALIYSGGDMWWDYSTGVARYEIPKGSGRHALYLGTIFIGGREASTNVLKVAGQTYRKDGVDYWTGPLDTVGTAEIDPETCELYDRLWTMNRQMVEDFRFCYNNPTDPACIGYTIPNEIKNWPGNPIIQANEQHFNMQNILAPFYDNPDGPEGADRKYNPEHGDYPYYDLDNTFDCKIDRSALLYGDFTLWWVFNDKGNIHSESEGTAIGMEIRAQAFGFNTNDEINNMSFYNYQLINRGTTTLNNCYFGVNTDADLGGANDDYVGCDVSRGFGYIYNADDFDGNQGAALGYGNNPPAVGIDFFLGPYCDNNGIAEFWDRSWDPNSPPSEVTAAFSEYTPLTADNIHNSILYGINGVGFDDTIVDNERFGMRRFVYYSNSSTSGGVDAIEDPDNATDFYNYLRGYWRNNTPMTYFGNGYNPGNASAIRADFMFPGSSDPWNWGTRGIATTFDWTPTETGGGTIDQPGDKRFVQSAGPFTLKPGAVNDLTTGAVWARATSGNSFESVLKVLAADMKAQSLFENCFRVLNGPDAPTLTIKEYDQELILFLTNKVTSNNYLNKYIEKNYFIDTIGYSQITKDTTIWVPSFTQTTLSGTNYFLYNTSQGAEDTLLVLTAGGIPVDTSYGYLTNQSNLVNTVIQTGEYESIRYDNMIRFEGYLIYQLKDKTVQASDIFSEGGNDKGRLVAQCDIRNFDALGNPIGRIVNFEFDDALGYSVPVVKVDGANEGIRHSFKITEDEFATGDKKLVNHKTYYYAALAYGYNNYKNYDPSDASSLDGQKEPFFLGRRGYTVVAAVPHINAPENNGTIINSLYGFGPKITRIEGRGNGGNVLALTEETENEILANGKADRLTYQNGLGPVKIKIIDPASISNETFFLKVIDTTAASVRTVRNSATWVILDINNDTVAKSEKNLGEVYEQIIYDLRGESNKFLGFSVTMNQVIQPGPSWKIVSGVTTGIYTESTELEINGTSVSTPGNGLLLSQISFEKSDNIYLGFFADIDGSNPSNYVRQGTSFATDDRTWNSAHFRFGTSDNPQRVFIDPNGSFTTGTAFYGGGGLVPYILTSSTNSYRSIPTNPTSPLLPGHGISNAKIINGNHEIIYKNSVSYIGTVEVVITSDKSKWTRCPVIETQDDPTKANKDVGFPSTLAINKFEIRRGYSIDKDGNKNFATTSSTNPNDPNYLSPYGMGWFPGYVIDLETGDRLNIAYGEDSYLAGENGRDMIFNPSQADPTSGSLNGIISQFGDYLIAGKHYIYIFGSNATQGVLPAMGAWDDGQSLMTYLVDPTTKLPVNTSETNQTFLWRNCIWSGVPFNVTGKNWLDGECRIKMKVQKPYQKGYSAIRNAGTPTNFDNPLYEFTFDGLEVMTGDNATAVSALDLIQVVPNPYYASSEYETTPQDNRVKIVNLPNKCSISIYTLNGTLIRKFEKDNNTSTSVDWDLKNFKNIPISSGLYILHIKADGIGERIIKWYGVMRPLQLDNF